MSNNDDFDEDGKGSDDEYSTEDIERELSSKLMIERGKALPIKKIEVNFWASSLHGAKIGIKKDAQWQSKSRQFSPEMDIVGDVTYEFDQDKILNEAVLKYYESDRAKELGIPLDDIKKDPKTYEKLVLTPLKKLPKETKDKYVKDNNVNLPAIPPDNDRKLVIALNKRYWDTKDADKSKMEEIDSDADGKADAKKYLDNYLKRKFGEFADLNRRLILKIFRDMDHSEVDKRGIWMGSIEQSLIDSMMLTFGEKDPLFAATLTLPGFDYQIEMVRSHAITGQRFILPVIERKVAMEELFAASVEKGIEVDTSSTEKMPMNYYSRYFVIEGKRFTPGTDFIVKDPMNGNKVVAEIDGRAIDIGGKWEITFKDDTLSTDPLFRSNIILFALMIKYHPEMQKVMRKLYNEMKRKVRSYNDDELSAAIAMYIEKLEKEKGIKIPDKPGRIEFALRLLKSEKYDNVDIARLLRTKYCMHVTPHELSMLFNPRRVRS